MGRASDEIGFYLPLGRRQIAQTDLGQNGPEGDGALKMGQGGQMAGWTLGQTDILSWWKKSFGTFTCISQVRINQSSKNW